MNTMLIVILLSMASVLALTFFVMIRLIERVRKLEEQITEIVRNKALVV